MRLCQYIYVFMYMFMHMYMCEWYASHTHMFTRAEVYINMYMWMMWECERRTYQWEWEEEERERERITLTLTLTIPFCRSATSITSLVYPGQGRDTLLSPLWGHSPTWPLLPWPVLSGSFWRPDILIYVIYFNAILFKYWVKLFAYWFICWCFDAFNIGCGTKVLWNF